MKIKGIYETGTIYINGRQLFPNISQKAYNHSPDGFMWGYGGSGPAQLALALLMMVTDEKTAVKMHQRLKSEKITILPQSDFEEEINVEAWVRVNGGKVDRSNWERSFYTQHSNSFTDRAPACTKGYEDRCQKARSGNCNCDCFGVNHGAVYQITL